MGFWSRVFVGTSIDKVNKANSKVESALTMFQKANNQIDEANNMLDEAKHEDQQMKEALLQQVSDIESNMSKADKEKEANLKLKEKLSEFVK